MLAPVLAVVLAVVHTPVPTTVRKMLTKPVATSASIDRRNTHGAHNGTRLPFGKNNLKGAAPAPAVTAAPALTKSGTDD